MPIYTYKFEFISYPQKDYDDLEKTGDKIEIGLRWAF